MAGPAFTLPFGASVGWSRDRQQRRRPKSRHTDGVVLGDPKRLRNVPEAGWKTR